jgi:hypothetical protein
MAAFGAEAAAATFGAEAAACLGTATGAGAASRGFLAFTSLNFFGTPWFIPLKVWKALTSSAGNGFSWLRGESCCCPKS